MSCLAVRLMGYSVVVTRPHCHTDNPHCITPLLLRAKWVSPRVVHNIQILVLPPLRSLPPPQKNPTNSLSFSLSFSHFASFIPPILYSLPRKTSFSPTSTTLTLLFLCTLLFPLFLTRSSLFSP
uniref:Uncharacterized protein n=1 Tax=Cacopsylla melanoneura TaxID=428564 RepID=A0A8D8Q9X8_9HEMI